MTQDLLDASLRALAETDEAERPFLVARLRQLLLKEPAAVVRLVRHLIASIDHPALDQPLDLLVGVLDEARMSQENGSPEGPALLERLASEVATLEAEGRLPLAARLGLGQAYARADLALPPRLQFSLAEFEAASPMEAIGEPGAEFDRLLDQVREMGGGEPWHLHTTIKELMAAFPTEMRAAMVAELAARPDADLRRLALYWLLDPEPALREAAAGAWLRRARSRVIDGAELAKLTLLRKWQPADGVRALLDQTIREALQRGVQPTAPPKPWQVRRVQASIPDGVGAQSFAVAAQRGRARVVAMLLFKAGYGVKDAFVIACRNAAEQRNMMDRLVDERVGLLVDVPFLHRALGYALGEGLDQGVLPSPALVDVAEIIGSDALQPLPHDVHALLADLDPEGRSRNLTPEAATAAGKAALAALLDVALGDTWFEDTGELRAALAAAPFTAARYAAFWNHFEGRRAFWAAILVRTAMLLRTTEPADEAAWVGCAMTARALVDGEPLPGLLLIEAITHASLKAFEARSEAPPLDEAEPAAALEATGLTGEWLDGWLTAGMTAPREVAPAAWLESFVHRLTRDEHVDWQGVLMALQGRTLPVTDYLAEPTSAAAHLLALQPAERRAWVQGFLAFVDAVPKAWPQRKLSRDDRLMLACLEDATSDMPDAVARRIATWLTR
ncbi:MAG: hypothetical protein EA356_07625 [Geminicoccaceae bacterium]|nr:MAG: hypothetical protein EA356_07625 [Geminicoccaceae bacterium]